jgi:hypothetical protein
MPAQFHARSFVPDRRTRNRFCSLVDVYGAPERGSGAAGVFRIVPIVGLKNWYARLQEGKVTAMGN